MCGIFGIYNLDGQPVNLTDVECATNLMKHRGPNDEGYALFNIRSSRSVSCGGQDTDERLKLPALKSMKIDGYDLVFGFRRLSILDLSQAGHQPMCTSDGRYWIMMNGEVYNYLEIRAELKNYGYTFQTESDTEVILAAYQHWGKDCLHHFNGMWGLAIWDNKAKELFIARDRFGVKPIYYTWDKKRFTFASEIKALIGTHGIRFEADQNVVYHYLVSGLLPNAKSGQTFFKNVNSLPPGNAMVLSSSGLYVYPYWTLKGQEDNEANLPFEKVRDEFISIFEDAVKLRLRSDVPVGSCLSGGIDSSAIVSTVNRFLADKGMSYEQIGDKQRTFSAVYDLDGPFNELKYIDLLLSTISVQGHKAYPMFDRLQADAERLIWHQEEPFPSTSIFAQWCVISKVHENGVTVLLDGQGVDEMMGGYRPFAKFLADFLRGGKFIRAFQETKALYDTISLSAFRYLLTGLGYALPFTSSYVFSLQEQMQNDGGALNQSFARSCQNSINALSSSHYLSLDDHLRNIFEDSNLPNLLRYQDRNSMAFGVEARVPFLDYRMVEYVFGKAAPWRIHQGWTKYILRRAVEPNIPPQITWRKDKVGFAVPEEIWLYKWMRSTNMEMFNNTALCSEYLDLCAVRNRIERWLYEGKAIPPVWRWINLELWLKAWQRA